MPNWESVLEFWFGPLGERGKPRPEWFRKDAAFDGEIARRFGDLHRAASRREREAWRMSSQPLLALVVVLDQFSRNLYRGDARAFAQDAYARECANEAIERGDDLTRLPVERQFLYLPFVHGETLADQDRGVQLMASLASFQETRDAVVWAEKHRAIVPRVDAGRAGVPARARRGLLTSAAWRPAAPRSASSCPCAAASCRSCP
jgi:uncharacterized protein (DUF924 family)